MPIQASTKIASTVVARGLREIAQPRRDVTNDRQQQLPFVLSSCECDNTIEVKDDFEVVEAVRMRGFSKAAALLFATRALTFVIPDSVSLSTPPSNAVIEYYPREASLKFDITSVETSERYPTFTFQVEATRKACGESNVLLNGLKLDSEWHGTTAHGRGYLDIYGGKEAQWHISCLFDTLPADGSNSHGEDVVHVLSLMFGPSADESQPGFTISYRQMAPPAVLRFRPKYSQLGVISRPGFADRWRTASVDFEPIPLEDVQENDHPATFGFIGQGQKSLGSYLKALKGSLASGVSKAVKKFCPKYGEYSAVKAIAISSDRLLEPAPTPIDAINDQTLTTTKAHDSTNTVPNHSAAETRSLTYLETSNPSAASSTTPFQFQSEQQTHILKVFGVILILSSLFAWICLRCRDPRRRAECLARREERRNRKLYRRAARQHKVKMWFWSFRMKYGLAPSEVLSWDEKRARVIQQESLLDRVMTDDIRALRNAHRVVSSITAAEEGRNGFAYESEGSERRRSFSTLPDYESEGSQPPNYDDVGGSLEGTDVGDGFHCTPAEAEFRSDSSVISTSPRISRDGTNSDFDEKFEPIFLETTGSAGSVF